MRIGIHVLQLKGELRQCPCFGSLELLWFQPMLAQLPELALQNVRDPFNVLWSGCHVHAEYSWSYSQEQRAPDGIRQTQFFPHLYKKPRARITCRFIQNFKTDSIRAFNCAGKITDADDRLMSPFVGRDRSAFEIALHRGTRLRQSLFFRKILR